MFKSRVVGALLVFAMLLSACGPSPTFREVAPDWAILVGFTEGEVCEQYPRLDGVTDTYKVDLGVWDAVGIKFYGRGVAQKPFGGLIVRRVEFAGGKWEVFPFEQESEVCCGDLLVVGKGDESKNSSIVFKKIDENLSLQLTYLRHISAPTSLPR